MTTPDFAAGTLLTNREGIERVLGAEGLNKRVNVSRTTVVSAVEEEQVEYSIAIASGHVLSRLGNRYAAQDLQADPLVFSWASTFAAAEVCFFQMGFIPAVLQAKTEALDDRLERIMLGQDRLEHLPGKSGSGVALDNMRLDGRFRYKQLRRERTISDGHATQKSPQIEDITNIYLYERNA